MARKKHYADLTPIQKKEILTAPGPVELNGFTYTTQELGPDLVMIWVDKDGERQPSSIGVIPSQLEDHITKFIQSSEKQDQVVQIRISTRLLEKANSHAEKNNQNFSELVRSLLESL